MAYTPIIQRDYKFLASGRRRWRPLGGAASRLLPGRPGLRRALARAGGLARRYWQAGLIGAACIAGPIPFLMGLDSLARPCDPGLRELPLALPAASAMPAAAGPEVTPWTEDEVKPGDTLAAIFQRHDLSARVVYDVVHAGEPAQALTRLYPGRKIRLDLREGRLEGLEYLLDETHLLNVDRDHDTYAAQVNEVPLEHRLVQATGTIHSSLFDAGLSAGLSDSVVMQLATIFGWDIDFILDIRSGDSFAVVYEELYRDGEKLRDGDILAAEFLNRGRLFRAVRYREGDQRAEYYDPDGRNLRKAFLRSPMDVTRVTSRFTMKRFHPILKINRPHRGVDYGATRGTPVKATGDGTVVYASKNSGYGNHVIIQHANQYKTLYGHLSRFANGIHRGSKVRQGQVVGYVGMTGLATAPHLHYEFRVNDVHKDPLKIDFPKVDPLPQGEMPEFRVRTRPLFAELDVLGRRLAAPSAAGTRVVAAPAE